MKTTLIAFAALIAIGAHAHGTQPPTTPTPSAPVQTTQVGITSIAAALARGGAGGQGGLGGAGGVATGGQVLASGNLALSQGAVAGGALNLAGAQLGSNVDARQGPTIVGATPTQGGLGTCPKPGFGIGGSGSNGGGFLNATFGTDDTCRIGQALQLMDRSPALFTEDDRKLVTCKQEDVAQTSTCKELARKQAEAARAGALLEDRPEPVARAQRMPWQAGG
jgi:hypothetical protein